MEFALLTPPPTNYGIFHNFLIFFNEGIPKLWYVMIDAMLWYLNTEMWKRWWDGILNYWEPEGLVLPMEGWFQRDPHILSEPHISSDPRISSDPYISSEVLPGLQITGDWALFQRLMPPSPETRGHTRRPHITHSSFEHDILLNWF